MADRAGQQLGNYRLVRRLGSGGFAEVYLAEHIYLKKQVAVKVLHLELAQQELPNFLQEAQTIARLQHPNIISVTDFGIDDVSFLVMEYLPRGSLRDHHPYSTKVPLPTVVSYLKQVASALQYAHDTKVIHRDVKPANMLLGNNDQIILSDFGIATTAHRTVSLQTQQFTGSPHYTSPEQIAGKPRAASDQYSLAMVVYEWLCGSPAFVGEIMSVMFQQTYAPVPSLREHVPTIPPEIEQVVLKALAKDPQQRFESVQAFAQAFITVCERLLAPTINIPPQPLAPTIPARSQEKPAQQKPPVSQKTHEQWLEEGNAHYYLQQYDKAIADYTEALRLNPQYANAYYNRGNVYYVLKQYDKALADYDQALRLNPNHSDAQKWRQEAYRLLHQK